MTDIPTLNCIHKQRKCSLESLDCNCRHCKKWRTAVAMAAFETDPDFCVGLAGASDITFDDADLPDAEDVRGILAPPTAPIIGNDVCVAAEDNPMEWPIASRWDVLNGTWCVTGTRIPVATLIRYREAGYSDEYIVREYPTLTPELIENAITAFKAFCPPAAPDEPEGGEVEVALARQAHLHDTEMNILADEIWELHGFLEEHGLLEKFERRNENPTDPNSTALANVARKAAG